MEGAAPDQPAVSVERLAVRYGSTLALDDASARADAGTFVCLVGLNGSGKSTLLKAIVGTVPAHGRVSVQGVEDRRRSRFVAYVPQREDVNWGFPITVLEVVLMGRASALKRLGWTNPADREEALEALTRVGAQDLRSRAIGELSGGQQQRVVLARALFSQAPVMLLDEPLSGVDPGTQNVILRLLREHCLGGGTVLMATHDVLGSADVADRVWGVNRTIVADVPAALLLEEEVLRRIYGQNLLLLPTGQVAVGDQAL